MKRTRGYFLAFLIPGLLATGCHRKAESGETSVTPRVPVTVVSPRNGAMAEYTELTATSAFMVKAQIKSPVAGYVEKCSFIPGDRVSKGQLIFQLRTKEAAALNRDTAGPVGISGLVRIAATLDGIISGIDHPRGDYIQEGDPLCTIVVPESLAFILEVPFELSSLVKKGSSLSLVLPDNRQITAIVKSNLPSMTGASQTQRVILEPGNPSQFPENLVARARILKSTHPHAIIIPKSCMLSDEIMKNFWIMKLVNDTLAVRVPVTAGTLNRDSIEILSPKLDIRDRILDSGNYGLGDTAIVKVIHK